AFMGGAVGLSRRLPEYQKRCAPGYVGTDKQPAVTTDEAREYVIFQMLQLLAAPLIAIVAYHAIDPGTMGAAISLAFVSGFASEPILLQIRGMVEGLRPPVGRTAWRVTGTVVNSSNSPVKEEASVTLKNSSGKSVVT